MAGAARAEQPDLMNDVANDLARLVVQEREQRRRAEDTASELAILLVKEQTELERERQAREQAEAQAQELSTLILGDTPPREPARFIPARTRLKSVS
jgi:hypothetical protein